MSSVFDCRGTALGATVRRQVGRHTSRFGAPEGSWRASRSEFRRALLVGVIVPAGAQAARASGDGSPSGAGGSSNCAAHLAERLGHSSEFGPFARSAVEVTLVAEPAVHLIKLTHMLA